jgi:hypothetical protein
LYPPCTTVQYIKEGESYDAVKKVISVTIAYFDLGQGEDYVYHGTNTFRGIYEAFVERLRKLASYQRTEMAYVGLFYPA